MDLKEVINSRLTEFKDLRKLLHNNAELGFSEYKTQKIIMDYLSTIGIKSNKLAKTGVVGVMNDGCDCNALRVDIDALPINGVFHGCGHDYHMAIALGTASTLKAMHYDKCFKFIFQPAEETTGGALPMIKEGVLNEPKVKNLLGFHVWPDVELGTIEVTDKASMASVDDFKITFKGKGGHAAIPSAFINPIVPGVEFIKDMNDYFHASEGAYKTHILSITTLKCGEAPNVVSDSAVVMGTLRTFDEGIRKNFKNKIISLASSYAEQHHCHINIDYDEQYPPLKNDMKLTKAFKEITANLIGSKNVLDLMPTFAGEDFAFFSEAAPSVHFRLGITHGEKGRFPLHSQYFTADDNCIFYGIYILTNFILKYL
ncbi:M20 family metallopeptidase [Clostridium oryzae]|uniref:Putative hydrolase YxeP n=1 Tax=Clostridium oryzae TaxID=1450648 RepID=A0A1V4INP8_9CLOT|nr:M20 family metallopeptidase [Clostridium oryzae]OPJ61661.1 putative hydrolase YxeP [Clostridium oryzae]